MLRLLYGNDKRNPIRTLDLAETAAGNIALKAGGFSPSAGEKTELWTDPSIRHDGQKLLAESMANSELSITYVLHTGGSQAGLGYFQRKVHRFFQEVKQYNAKYKQGHQVWLEVRWPDGLNALPTPAFGQLSSYYQIYLAKSPRWPADIYDYPLEQGIIDGVSVDFICSPAPEGLKQKAANAMGTITHYAKGILIASGASTHFRFTSYTGTGLTANFAITGWMTLNATWSSGTKDIFDYYVNASNRIRIQYDRDNTRWVITKIVGGTTFTANSASDTVANGDDVHLVLVQDSTTLYLYVNGALAASVAATATMTDGGTIALGCAATGATDGVDIIVDGWRILPDDISATLSDAIYDAELPIKTDGGQVGPPPYLWTVGGAGSVGACDDVANNNWGVIGGIGGDIEARLDIRLKVPDTASKYYWLGIKSQDSTFTPADFIWFEFAGGDQPNVSDVTASDGEYRFDGVPSTVIITSTKPSVDPTLMLGKYHLLCRQRINSVGTATVTPGWFFTNNIPKLLGRTTSFSYASGAWQVRSMGDVFIMTDGDLMIETQSSISLGLNLAVVKPEAAFFHTDFAFLLPAPFAKITRPDHASSASPTATIPLVIEDGHAHIHTEGGIQSDRYEYIGDRLTALPHKYNYLFLLRLDSSQEFLRTNLTTVSVFITPRYLLPGGMVA